MATYNWNGTSFDGQSFVPSQFMIVDGGTYYYWEQNYKQFFPVTLDADNNPTYIGNGTGITLPVTQLFSVDQWTGATNFGMSILAVRLSTYTANTATGLSAATQLPSSFVGNAITSALGGSSSIINLTQGAKGVLTSPSMGFVVHDILSSWPGGQTLLTNLAGMFANNQTNISGVSSKVQSVLDFKKRLIGAGVTQADKVRQIQAQIDMFATQGTFTTMVSAFPTVMGPFQALLNNQNKVLTTQVTQYLPAAAAELNNIANMLFHIVVGSIAPAIINPIDKIFNDVNKLEDQGLSFLNSIPILGFNSLQEEGAMCNQFVNLLNNALQDVPVTSLLTPQSPTTDPNAISAAIKSYSSKLLGLNNTQTATQAAAIQAKVATSTTMITSATNPPVNPADPSQGGSLGNTIASQTLTKTVNAPLPTLTQAADPSVATAQNARTVAQTAANQPGTTSQTVRGNCINNINDVPLKPRSTPLDGSLGSFSTSSAIPF